jgi:hypothetical protein
MTETEWLNCTDPGSLAWFLGDRLSDRKLRLFGCACVRGVWNDLPDDALRRATEVCERFADGFATAEELRATRDMAHTSYQGIGDIIADHSALAVTGLCQAKAWFPMGEGSSAGIAAVAAEAWSGQDLPWHVAWDKAKQTHCQLLRDVSGNPFHPVTLDPSWQTWNGGTLPKLAQAAYEDRQLPLGLLDSHRMGVLADAFEEAGCTRPEILDHARQQSGHIRGCWLIDLLTGRR